MVEWRGLRARRLTAPGVPNRLADQAMVNFSVALDLKPASADVNLIKSAIEKLHVPDDSEDEDL